MTRDSSKTMTVYGLAGATLLDVVARTWSAPATVARTSVLVRGHPGWDLVTRSGYSTRAYQAGDVVYFVMSSDPNLINAISADMP